MTTATPHQPYLHIYKLATLSSEEYCDYFIRVYRSFKQVFKEPLIGASWGPGANPPHPQPVGGPEHSFYSSCISVQEEWFSVVWKSQD